MAEDTTPEQTDTQADSTEDFDAFWSKRDRKRKTTTIAGRAITLPASLPLQFELEARKVAKSKRTTDVHKLVAILFGQDAFTAFAKGGMDLEQFKVLLAWAPQVIGGRDVTLAEVAAQVAELEAASPDPT